MHKASWLFHGLILAFFTSSVLADDIEVHDAWISEAPPTVTVLAGYLAITNHSEQAAELTEVSSPMFDSIEIHKSRVVDGMARMEKQAKLVIPAGSEIEFKPGGLHLMLFDPARPLRAGDSVELTLVFNENNKSTVMAEVKNTARQHHHHHHH